MVTLIITEIGSKLQIKKNRFLITHGFSRKPVSEIPIDLVDQIISESSCTITAQAMAALSKYAIPFVWVGPENKSLYILPTYQNGLASLRRRQYAAMETKKGVHIAKQIVFYNIKNRITTLSKWKKEYDLDLNDQIIQIRSYLKNPPTLSESLEESRNLLMAFEAKVAKEYWKGFRLLAENLGWPFNGRTKRPAKDGTNALLNYGYAILEAQALAAVSITGLDIYAGYLHTDRSGRTSLLQDIKEEFRQVLVDEALVQFMSRTSYEKEHFEKEGSDIRIGTEIKKQWVTKLFTRLETEFGKYSLRRHIAKQGRKLANYLMNKRKSYSPFQNKVRYP